MYWIYKDLVCNPNPCFNQGTCIQTGSTTAYCNCMTGYTGTLCQTCNIRNHLINQLNL